MFLALLVRKRGETCDDSKLNQQNIGKAFQGNYWGTNISNAFILFFFIVKREGSLYSLIVKKNKPFHVCIGEIQALLDQWSHREF
jgi:hypothetical protein